MKKIDNKNAFLMTCVSCIVLLLAMCYFGINSMSKGTMAITSSEIQTFCLNNNLTYVSSIDACCPTGYTSSNSFVNDSGEARCVMNGASTAKTDENGELYWSRNVTEEDPLAVSCTEKNGYYECRYREAGISTAASVVVEYTASFKNEDGSDYQDVTCTGFEDTGCIITLPTAPSKAGRTFKGWTSTQGWCDSGLRSSNFTTYMDEDYYPCWVDQYDITYSLNGGTKGTYAPTGGTTTSVTIDNPTKTVTVTGDANGTGATVGSATSSVQTFAGWTMTGGASTAKYSTDASTWNTWDGTTKVTARYFKDLGTMNTTVTMVANWTPVALTLPTVTKTDHTCGWNSNSTGTTIEYASGASYTPSATSAASITMYAVCNENASSGDEDTDTSQTFTGTFKNGSTTYDTKTCTTSVGGSSCSMPIPSAPSKSGYTFKGWGNNDGCSSGSTSSFTVTSNVTKYACWVANSTGDDTPSNPTTYTYTATFNANGGTLNGSSTKSCTSTSSSCTITGLPTATKSGYTFKGWGTSNSCTSGNTSSLVLNLTNKTYYACYEKDAVVEEPEEDDNNQNITENPQTGQIAIFVVWVIALAAIVYSVWYFKKIREN